MGVLDLVFLFCDEDDSLPDQEELEINYVSNDGDDDRSQLSEYDDFIDDE